MRVLLESDTKEDIILNNVFSVGHSVSNKKEKSLILCIDYFLDSNNDLFEILKNAGYECMHIGYTFEKNRELRCIAVDILQHVKQIICMEGDE